MGKDFKMTLQNSLTLMYQKKTEIVPENTLFQGFQGFSLEKSQILKVPVFKVWQNLGRFF